MEGCCYKLLLMVFAVSELVVFVPQKRKASDLLKQPKHLSAEGRINRARRGNVRAIQAEGCRGGISVS